MSQLEIITLLVTPISFIVGSLAIWYQVHAARLLNKGAFLVELDNSFDTHHNKLLGKLIKHTRQKRSEGLTTGSCLTEEDVIEFVAYLTFFEILFHLIERRLLTLREVDDLFGYRFFIAVENDVIQDEDLCRDRQDYRNIFRLHKLWSNFRKSNSNNYLIGVRNLPDWPGYALDNGPSYENLTS